MPDPGREPPSFSVALDIFRWHYRREITGRANRILMTAMALCTLLVCAEMLAGLAWLIAQAAQRVRS